MRVLQQQSLRLGYPMITLPSVPIACACPFEPWVAAQPEGNWTSFVVGGVPDCAMRMPALPDDPVDRMSFALDVPPGVIAVSLGPVPGAPRACAIEGFKLVPALPLS